MNKANLIIGGLHLLENVKEENFDMGQYRQERDDEGELQTVAFYSEHNCGTVGCAAGNMPFVNTPDFKPIGADFIKKVDLTTLSSYTSFSLSLIHI